MRDLSETEVEILSRVGRDLPTPITSAQFAELTGKCEHVARAAFDNLYRWGLVTKALPSAAKHDSRLGPAPVPTCRLLLWEVVQPQQKGVGVIAHWAVRRLANGYWSVVPPSGVAIERGCFPMSGQRGLTEADALTVARFGHHLTAKHPDPLQSCGQCAEDLRIPMYDHTGEPWLPGPDEIEERRRRGDRE